ncbi:MAG: 50S ribosomal protein L4 [Anaerolineae bacterium]|nr:50S ribosomal protein L4 [Anaerolineae bacterium]
MVVPMYNAGGDKIGEVELSADIFEVPVNIPLMHQAVQRQLANARAGTHKAKSRGEINRTKAKWYRQKGTGRARHGSRNAPIFVGGGVAHGPTPRSYAKQMPRKMRRAAVRSALSVKVGDGQWTVVDELLLAGPKTKDVVGMLQSLGLGGSVLVLLPEANEIVEKAARNLPRVKVMRASYVNVRDLLIYDDVLVPLDSLRVLESILG